MELPQKSILFLKTCLIILLLLLIGLAGYGVSALMKGITSSLIFEKPGYIVLIVAYMALIPLIFSIFHGLRILQFISKSSKSIDLIFLSAQMIRKSFLFIAFLALCILPIFFYIGQMDDAPGLVLVGIILIVVPLAVSAIFRCFQYILKDHFLS